MQATKFLSGITGKLAERWVATLFTPAFVFWAGGGLVALQLWGWNNPVRTAFNDLSDSIKIVTLVLLLIGVSVSGFVVEKFDGLTLRWLEGYWPGWLRSLRRKKLARLGNRYDLLDDQWQTLEAKRRAALLTPDENGDHSRLAWQLYKIPVLPEQRMPTRLGNILRTAELAPLKKYGLDSFLCWPRLWMVLPEQARGDLSAAREELNTAARAWLWSVLFCLWAMSAFWMRPFYYGLWPLLIGWIFTGLAYQWAVQSAENYALLLESAYDLYRFDLYEALGIEQPSNQAFEKQQGERLNRHLFRSY